MTPGRGRLRVWRGAALLSIACVDLADQRRTPGGIAAVIALTQPPLHIGFALASHPASAHTACAA